MSYEDMTELQNINYGTQNLNQGYARFPNVTGDFVIQRHTFNGNNSTVVSTDEVEDIGLILYPNPTADFISIESDEPVRRILSSDITGKEVGRVENPQFPYNLNGLPSGIYFMRFDFNDQSYTVKIM